MTFAPTSQNELLSCFDQLKVEDQARVVEFARALAAGSSGAKAPRGTPGKELLNIVGIIPHEDLKEMTRVIDQECERINLDEW